MGSIFKDLRDIGQLFLLIHSGCLGDAGLAPLANCQILLDLLLLKLCSAVAYLCNVPLLMLKPIFDLAQLLSPLIGDHLFPLLLLVVSDALFVFLDEQKLLMRT